MAQSNTITSSIMTPVNSAVPTGTGVPNSGVSTESSVPIDGATINSSVPVNSSAPINSNASANGNVGPGGAAQPNPATQQSEAHMNASADQHHNACRYPLALMIARLEIESENLRAQSAILQTENARLKTDCSAMRTSHALLEGDVRDLLSQITVMEGEISDYREENASLRESGLAHHQRLGLYWRTLDEADSLKAQGRAQLKAAQEEVASWFEGQKRHYQLKEDAGVGDLIAFSERMRKMKRLEGLLDELTRIAREALQPVHILDPKPQVTPTASSPAAGPLQ